MVKYLIVDAHKGIPQEKAAAQLTRGAFLESGYFIADKERNYDGLNSLINFKEKEFETIEIGDIYNKIPTRVGEEYATTEVDGAAALTAGASLTVDAATGKLKAGAGDWAFVGEYANPYDLVMYHVKRVK